MALSLSAEWNSAKKHYEFVTSEKKPSKYILGIARVGSGIEKELTAFDKARAKGNFKEMQAFYKAFISKHDDYKKNLQLTYDETEKLREAADKASNVPEKKRQEKKMDALKEMMISLKAIAYQARAMINRLEQNQVELKNEADLKKIYKNAVWKDAFKLFCKNNYLVGEFNFFQSWYAGSIVKNSDDNWKKFKPSGAYGLNISSKTVKYVEGTDEIWPKKWAKVYDEVWPEFISANASLFREFMTKKFSDM